MGAVRDLVLPSIERHGVIDAWIIDDTGFSEEGQAFGRRHPSVLRAARQAGQLPATPPARRAPFRDYCRGLLMPVERKSVEPLAAVTAPDRAAAQHQSLLHFVGQGGWSGEQGNRLNASPFLPRSMAVTMIWSITRRRSFHFIASLLRSIR